jgi:hypothetical protein
MLVALSTPQEFAARQTLASFRSSGSELTSASWSASLVTPSRGVSNSASISQEMEVVGPLSGLYFSDALRGLTEVEDPAATAQARIKAAQRYVDSKFDSFATPA